MPHPQASFKIRMLSETKMPHPPALSKTQATCASIVQNGEASSNLKSINTPSRGLVKEELLLRNSIPGVQELAHFRKFWTLTKKKKKKGEGIFPKRVGKENFFLSEFVKFPKFGA